jgi:UDP-N-acetylmuramate: L-alanyl-gamma-D-glutamyl-meso-diaminopimelate ligase
VGSQIEGFALMANLEEKNTIAVIEGDEYLASPIDRRPKFHLYQANIGLITGLAWDHINVFPTYAEYVKQFDVFAKGIRPGDHLVYCAQDEGLVQLVKQGHYAAEVVPYYMPDHYINHQQQTVIRYEGKEYPLQVFGAHNLMNMDGARHVCNLLGIHDADFYQAITGFKGAAKRLEPIYRDQDFIFYRDFAHSPSKLKATTQAMRQQFDHYRLLACMELHTFSSLNENFLEQYAGTLQDADVALVYFNPQTIAHKKLKPITPEQVKKAFDRNDLLVFTDSLEMKKYLLEQHMKGTCLLMMSSGTFDGYDFYQLAKELKPHGGSATPKKEN